MVVNLLGVIGVPLGRVGDHQQNSCQFVPASELVYLSP